jgi:pimeloyl-ACP methyl ester carboxylesterase
MPPTARPESILSVVTSLGIETFSLMGTAGVGPMALGVALHAPERVHAVVLEAPGPERDAELERRLSSLATPTLVLCGTRDSGSAPAISRAYTGLLPNGHLVFVYDAAHAISADRPEAFAEVVLDFLERREAFVISRTATVIHP